MEPDVLDSGHGDEPPRPRCPRPRWAVVAGVLVLAAAGGVAGLRVASSGGSAGPGAPAATTGVPGAPTTVPPAVALPGGPALPPLPPPVVPPPPLGRRMAHLTMPRPGRVGAGTLADGTLVYVVPVGRGRARLVEAVSPVRVAGLSVQLGWCGAGGVFVDPANGAAFDRLGRYVSGTAARDLAYYPARRVGGEFVVGPRHEPTRRSAGVAAGPCPVRERRAGHAIYDLTYAQYLARGIGFNASAHPPFRPGPIVGVLAVSPEGRLRLCDGFQGRSDCGRAGHPVAGVAGARLAAGRYPWVLVRAGYGRYGPDGAVHDLAIAGTPYPVLAPATELAPGRELYVSEVGVSGRTLTGDPVAFLVGDAAQLAAARDRAEVPAPNDHYTFDPDRRPRQFRLADDAVFVVLALARPDGQRVVDYDRWARVVRQGHRLWALRLDAAGNVASVREQFVP